MNMIEAAEFMSASESTSVRIRLSRTETEALCYKATRGAGFSWGLAEEAANAVVWLCLNGIDGTAVLLAAIVAPTFAAPEVSNELWINIDGKTLCPLTTGTAIVDFASSVFGRKDLRTQIGPVRQPALLLPFLSQCAEVIGGSFVVEWDGRNLHVGNGISTDIETLSTFISTSVATIVLRRSDHMIKPVCTKQFALASPHTIAALDALAMRTTVPATEQSRKGGAGAGTSDND